MTGPDRFSAAGGDDEAALLGAVARHYLTSRDFNGISTDELARRFTTTRAEVSRALAPLVRRGEVVALTPDLADNPSILRLDPPTIEQQIASMSLERSEPWWTVVAYPSARALAGMVDRSQYLDRPYSLRLALGEPKLHFAAFHPRVLDYYRQDPRYVIRADDVSGSIFYREEHKATLVNQGDDTHLETFGFCFDETPQRLVAVFLGYLSRLSPEHQQRWRLSARSGEFMLHPGYHNKLTGRWGASPISCFEAVTYSLEHVNAMCAAAGWQPLFKCTFRRSRPHEFGFLLLPTAKSFEAFIQALDKMLSDNLNHAFFPDTLERFTTDSQGYKVPKGTIALLESWLHSSIQLSDEAVLEEVLGVFRKVRKLRSKPSHTVTEDEWNDKYVEEQRALMREVLGAFECLGSILHTHPLAGAVQLPDALRGGILFG